MGDERPVAVAGQDYARPHRPTAVFTIDGGAVEYLEAALDAGVMPRLREVLDGGAFFGLALCEMPSFTNPNNLSIVTGVPPAVHGIAGNCYLDADGVERQLTEPESLRCATIHAAMWDAGVATLVVTAKDKLRRLLGAGGTPSVSAECASELELPQYGIGRVTDLLGPNPHIYDWRISAYALDIGLAVHRAAGPLGLLYVSLTDYVQHRAAPGTPLANDFYATFDARLGEYLEAGFLVGITADHGMNAKHDEDGSPRVVYLEDEIAAAGGQARAVLPITDPYTAHHGSLGSFAWLYVAPEGRAAAMRRLTELRGITEVYTGEEAAVLFEVPRDLVGDLVVTSDRHTVVGKSRAFHDLTEVPDGLRSHGGRYEQIVPLVVSEPLTEQCRAGLQGRTLRNRHVHDLVLNGVRPG